MEIIKAATINDFEQAKKLIREYHEWLAIDLCFQGFEAELNSLPEMYGHPNGSMILIKNDIDFIGCVGLRKKDSECCEMKRLYIKPLFHNKGAGRLLLNMFIDTARELKYKIVRLDTLSRLEAAIHLYVTFGFTEIEPYNFNPVQGVKYFELRLE